MYTVTLRKERATWYYYTENPMGGGFGSNYCGPRYIAVTRALQGIPQGASYRLVQNGKDFGIFTKQTSL